MKVLNPLKNKMRICICNFRSNLKKIWNILMKTLADFNKKISFQFKNFC